MIQSFVFFDLETTGLIRGTNMPRITEIALIAVSRKSLCESKEMPPRVTHKLVIPINPIIRIPPEVSVLTGIFNDNLDNVAPFKNNTYELMIQFIQTLSPPVCMVAHNGNQFDYPILLHELQSIGKEIPEGVLAIDSLNAFKHYFNKSSSEPNVSSKCTDNSSAFLEAPNSSTSKRQHTAEGDCLSMLKCIGKFASTFAHWADMNAVPLAIYSKKN
ncbi:three-prime repair exonuclease 1 isoform X2 [Orussus abietinus]|uniref:three-prime repair exonuclease 1 isoform X2 n=1 Tax=Orussus abietinus TaxID=222816 RepID=UPI000625B92E|nr:three-prime repair exonuclease 1 isoform X2 [Orussus abietinus]